MDTAKRNRLKAQGWQIGSVADFLQLTADESAYIELRLKLAKGLRRQRQERQLTQVQLARMLASSQSRVAKMEAGDPSVSLDLLIRSHLVLGSSHQDLAVLIGETTI
jgi:ribosome-binding protein aMBF1 (putative translation factor)